MVATKNPRREIASFLAMIFLIAAGGCKPAGPGALVQGDELLRRGNTAGAIEKLKRATALMPDEPRAWNLLGLAYHHAGEPRLALQAYRQALAKDRSNMVAVAHYNLGSLLLEQGNTAAAADELRSYTLITNSAPGLVKLGTAQARLRQFDAAERTFASALRLEPRNYEALNGVGVIRAQRNQRDAIQYFNSALQANPQYGPAILNAAVVAYQNPATKPAALQRCRDYLALHPNSPQSEAAKELVQQLEIELAPARAGISTTVVAHATSPSPLRSNVAPVAPSLVTQPPVSPRANSLTNPARTVAAVPKSNAAIVSKPVQLTNAVPSPAVLTPESPTNIPVTLVSVAPSPYPKIAAAEPIVNPGEPNRGPETVPQPNPVAVASEPPVDPMPEENQRRGFFTRLNPFRNKSKTLTNEGPSAIALPSSPTLAPEPASPPSAKPTFPRFVYRSLRPPAPGNRREAERTMQQALKAHRAGRTNEALSSYQVSITADPSYFEAYYNSALLALQSGDHNRSLHGWEMALAIEPDSLNARYNFALALKQGGFPHDAANELEKILDAKPTDSRAHLSLANLYAQQLNEREKARAHYLKLLELEPRNPQAPAIRFWLAGNP